MFKIKATSSVLHLVAVVSDDFTTFTRMRNKNYVTESFPWALLKFKD